MSKSELMSEEYSEEMTKESMSRCSALIDWKHRRRQLSREFVRRGTEDRYKQHRRNSKGGLHSQEKNAA